MSKRSHSWLPRFSLREFLGIVAFVAIACGALKFASGAWVTVLLSAILLVFAGATIVAFIHSDTRQAFAIGVAVAIGTYAIVWSHEPQITDHYVVDDQISTTYDGYLPTTQTLRQAWWLIKGRYYVEEETGHVIERSKSLADLTGGTTIGIAAPPGWTGTGGRVVMQILPLLDDFFAVGHCLWALLFAYLGGKFATLIYHRRIASESAERGG